MNLDIKKELEERNLTNRDLWAYLTKEGINISESMLSRYVNGLWEPKHEIITKKIFAFFAKDN